MSPGYKDILYYENWSELEDVNFYAEIPIEYTVTSWSWSERRLTFPFGGQISTIGPNPILNLTDSTFGYGYEGGGGPDTIEVTLSVVINGYSYYKSRQITKAEVTLA
jgi:hypothetical protein